LMNRSVSTSGRETLLVGGPSNSITTRTFSTHYSTTITTSASHSRRSKLRQTVLQRRCL